MRELIDQLHNPDDDRRWQAVQDLTTIGSPAVDELLRDLMDHTLDEKLRQSYLYIFEHQWNTETVRRLKPVCEALHSFAFRVAAPVAAKEAMGPEQPG